MICAGLSNILYPGDINFRSAKIRVHAFAVRTRGHVTLYADNVFTFIMLIDMPDLCHHRSRSIRFDENPSSDPILLGLSKFILYAHLISHFIVL